MLQHTKGNLIDLAEQGLFDVIVHGCNCQNTMGSGIAKELRARYPGVYQADCLATQHWVDPIEKLGNFSTYMTLQFIVINAYTQLHYLPRGVDHFEYESFYIILKKLARLYPGKRFGFPYIGMGLAGGSSKRILALLDLFTIEVEQTGGTVTLVEFG